MMAMAKGAGGGGCSTSTTFPCSFSGLPADNLLLSVGPHAEKKEKGGGVMVVAAMVSGR